VPAAQLCSRQRIPCNPGGLRDHPWLDAAGATAPTILGAARNCARLGLITSGHAAAPAGERPICTTGGRRPVCRGRRARAGRSTAARAGRARRRAAGRHVQRRAGAAGPGRGARHGAGLSRARARARACWRGGPLWLRRARGLVRGWRGAGQRLWLRLSAGRRLGVRRSGRRSRRRVRRGARARCAGLCGMGHACGRAAGAQRARAGPPMRLLRASLEALKARWALRPSCGADIRAGRPCTGLPTRARPASSTRPYCSMLLQGAGITPLAQGAMPRKGKVEEILYSTERIHTSSRSCWCITPDGVGCRAGAGARRAASGRHALRLLPPRRQEGPLL